MYTLTEFRYSDLEADVTVVNIRYIYANYVNGIFSNCSKIDLNTAYIT